MGTSNEIADQLVAIVDCETQSGIMDRQVALGILERLREKLKVRVRRLRKELGRK